MAQEVMKRDDKVLERKYYCRRDGRDLTEEEVRQHHCRRRRKGRRKGKKCIYLVLL